MKSNRRRARQCALQALFQMDLLGHFDPDMVFPEFWLRETVPETVRELAEWLVRGTAEHLEQIDPQIESSAENWRLTRMSIVDRSIIRLAIFETLHAAPPTPPRVVIDEAVELAKMFGTEQSSRFVNGILDNIVKSRLEITERTEQDD